MRVNRSSSIRVAWAIFCLLACVSVLGQAVGNEGSYAELQLPKTALASVPFKATAKGFPLKDGLRYPAYITVRVELTSPKYALLHEADISTLDSKGLHVVEFSYEIPNLMLNSTGTSSLRLSITGEDSVVQIREAATGTIFTIPGVLSILPPVATMVIAILLGQVIVALLVGVFMGSMLSHSLNPLTGLLRTFDYYLLGAIRDGDHPAVILFTFLLGGLIALVQKSGGAQGLAQHAKSLMTSPIRGQLCVWLLSLVIFFDDYSCILIVGSSLRSVVENCGVSKEKFGLIIHTLGVSLASTAPVSSWVGVEIGYIGGQLKELGLDWDPFFTLLRSMQYRFFPVLMVLFMLMVILTGKDYAVMRPFEAVARQDLRWKEEEEELERSGRSEEAALERRDHHHEPGRLDPAPGTPLRWYNAVVPFAFVVVATFVGMIVDGRAKISQMPPEDRPPMTIASALSHSDSITALVRATAGGWLLSFCMILLQGLLTLREAMEAWMEGMKEVLEPQFILLMAWALGTVIGEVDTAGYLASTISSNVPSALLPALTMMVSSTVAFATGSGFGTMGIVFPLISPLVWTISKGDGTILLHSFSAIIAGAAFGNSCSPIADTSILTSLAVHCSLQDHLKTLIPYVLTVAAVALVFGDLLVGLGLYPAWIAFVVGAAVLYGLLWLFTKRLDPILYSSDQDEEYPLLAKEY